ncbi:hypothetical protein FOA52_004654 [Chlamydomonas sp. UWO 241]|nr:hypothetical protein FOA52_004654 [Chlamydomonas sp. UWO 241]
MRGCTGLQATGCAGGQLNKLTWVSCSHALCGAMGSPSTSTEATVPGSAQGPCMLPARCSGGRVCR